MRIGFKPMAFAALAALTLMSFTLAIQEVSYSVRLDKSKVEWTGRKISGQHVGIIKIKSGSFKLTENLISSGKFVIDMTTIKATDTENPKLANHIKGEDFFNVKTYPESTLTITGSTSQGVDSLGVETLEVTGTMTILDKTKDITFKARNTATTENFVIYKVKLNIDRTAYGITYKSSALGEATIHDNFELKIKLVGEKQ